MIYQRRRHRYNPKKLTPKQRMLRDRSRRALTWISVLCQGFARELKNGYYHGEDLKEVISLIDIHLTDAANMEIAVSKAYRDLIQTKPRKKGKGKVN